MIAASRNHKEVLDLLMVSADIDIFVTNLQNESVYDIAAEKANVIMCEQIERCERAQWIKRHPTGNTRFTSTVRLQLTLTWNRTV